MAARTPAPERTDPPGGAATAPAGQAAAPAQTRAGRPPRDRYIDSLRALALVRVIAYHTFLLWWMPILVPSMGIMFALAGSLVAASLDRRAGNALAFWRKRLVRLLPPLWFLGLVLVPVMLLAGWTATGAHASPLDWRTLALWVLPLGDPPASDLGANAVIPLWYLRAYLWFLLLSPLALRAFRRAPVATLVAPLALLATWATGALPLTGRAADVVRDIGVYGACWVLGFAHHDGLVRRTRLRVLLPVAAVAMLAGLAWAFTHPSATSGHNIDDIPVANALYSLGAVLVLVRVRPPMGWLARHRVLDGLVTAINARAMTVYLWSNLAITIAWWGLSRVPALGAVVGGGRRAQLVVFVAALVLTAVAVLAVGWVEDVAARRRVRINPWPRRTAEPTAPAAVDTPSTVDTPADPAGGSPAGADGAPGDPPGPVSDPVTQRAAIRRRRARAAAPAAPDDIRDIDRERVGTAPGDRATDPD